MIKIKEPNTTLRAMVLTFFENKPFPRFEEIEKICHSLNNHIFDSKISIENVWFINGNVWAILKEKVVD